MAGSVQSNDEDVISAINVVPLVDITLVLLIIFMVTATYIVNPAIQVELPRARNATETPQSMLLSIVITRQGSLYLNGDRTDEAEIRRYIEENVAGRKDLEAVLSADREVPHGRFVAILDLVKGAGIARFAINTEADFTDASATTGEDQAVPPAP